MLKNKNIMNSTIICALPTQKNILSMARIGETIVMVFMFIISYTHVWNMLLLQSQKYSSSYLYTLVSLLSNSRKENNVIFWWIYNNNFYPWTILVPSAQVLVSCISFCIITTTLLHSNDLLFSSIFAYHFNCM